MRKILRSIYLDQSLDEALALRAETEHTTKAELMRAYIAAGLEQPARALGHNQVIAGTRGGSRRDNPAHVLRPVVGDAQEMLPARQAVLNGDTSRELSKEGTRRPPARAARSRPASGGG